MKPWTQIPLGELCEVTAGGTPSRAVASNFGGDIPWVKIGDMVQGRVVTTEERLSRSGLETSAAKILPAGTVLMSIFATIGRTAVLCVDAATNQAIVGITPRNADVLRPEYLRRFLDSQASSLERRARGVAQVNINSSLLKAVPVPLPPLPEQRRIAEILDKADALRVKRGAALAELDTLTQSIFLDMFGDPATNPKGWPVRTFDETMRDETSRAEKLQRSDYLPEGRYPVVDQGQSVIAGYCDDDRYLCPSELPVVVFGDHTRAVKLVRHRFVVGADGAKVLAPEPGVDVVFLSYLMRELPIPDLGYSRHMREVKRLAFPIPPIARQQEFARRVSGIEMHRESHDRSRLALDSFFASLQHRAFRGEL